MGAAAESEVRIGMAGKVERIRHGEPGRVTVGSAEQNRDRIARSYHVVA